MDILFVSANSADAYMDIEREQRTLQKLTKRYCVIYQTLSNPPPLSVSRTSS